MTWPICSERYSSHYRALIQLVLMYVEKRHPDAPVLAAPKRESFAHNSPERALNAGMLNLLLQAADDP